MVGGVRLKRVGASLDRGDIQEIQVRGQPHPFTVKSKGRDKLRDNYNVLLSMLQSRALGTLASLMATNKCEEWVLCTSSSVSMV